MDITAILEAVITLIMAVLTGIIIPLVRERIGAERYASAKKIVRTAVSAAEQLFPQHGMGEDRRGYVLEYLDGLGLKFDHATIITMIEDAVRQLPDAMDKEE